MIKKRHNSTSSLKHYIVLGLKMAQLTTANCLHMVIALLLIALPQLTTAQGKYKDHFIYAHTFEGSTNGGLFKSPNENCVKFVKFNTTNSADMVAAAQDPKPGSIVVTDPFEPVETLQADDAFDTGFSARCFPEASTIEVVSGHPPFGLQNVSFVLKFLAASNPNVTGVYFEIGDVNSSGLFADITKAQSRLVILEGDNILYQSNVIQLLKGWNKCFVTLPDSVNTSSWTGKNITFEIRAWGASKGFFRFDDIAVIGSTSCSPNNLGLGNLVWQDNNDNGVLDGGEPNLPNVCMNLYKDDGDGNFELPKDLTFFEEGKDAFIATTKTNSSGIYSFSKLPAGDYYVQVCASNFDAGGALSLGFKPVSVASATGNSDIDNQDHGINKTTFKIKGITSSLVSLSAGGEPTGDGDDANTNSTIDFGFATFIPLTLGNLVWEDVNEDGLYTANEFGLGGVKLNLYRDIDNSNTFTSADELLDNTITDIDGIYKFTNVDTGKYVVEIPLKNWDLASGALNTYRPSKGKDPAVDPDGGGFSGPANVDNDDNGVVLGLRVVSRAITLAPGTEPTTDGDGDNGNLTLDFAFTDNVGCDTAIYFLYNNNSNASEANRICKVKNGKFSKAIPLNIPGVSDIEIMKADLNNPNLVWLYGGFSKSVIKYNLKTSFGQKIGNVPSYFVFPGSYPVSNDGANKVWWAAGASNNSLSATSNNIYSYDIATNVTTTYSNPSFSGSDLYYKGFDYAKNGKIYASGFYMGVGIYYYFVQEITLTGLNTYSTNTVVVDSILNPTVLNAWDFNGTRDVFQCYTPEINYLNCRFTGKDNVSGLLKVVSYTLDLSNANPLSTITKQFEHNSNCTEYINNHLYMGLDGRPILFGAMTTNGSPYYLKIDQFDTNVVASGTACPSYLQGPTGGLFSSGAGGQTAHYAYYWGASQHLLQDAIVKSCGPGGGTAVAGVMSIGNLVWNDLNNNGYKDSVETGIDGVKVDLFVDDGDTLFSSVNDIYYQTTTTEFGGNYTFSDLPVGKYFVRINSENFSGSHPLFKKLNSTGNVLSNADSNNADHGFDPFKPESFGVVSSLITLTTNGEPITDGDADANTNLSIDFGFYQSPSNLCVGNQVWNDLNNSYMRDAGEPGISNVTLELWEDIDGDEKKSVADMMVAFTTTDNNGVYNFCNLSSGVYYINIPASNFAVGAPLEHLVSSSSYGGCDFDFDNDDEGIESLSNLDEFTNGIHSTIVTLQSGNEPDVIDDGDGKNGNMTVDFGFFRPVNIGNLIFGDGNLNGIKNVSDTGIANVLVDVFIDNGDGIYNPSSDIYYNALPTDSNGNYDFIRFAAGKYFVRVNPINFDTVGGVLQNLFSSPNNVGGNSDINDSDHGIDDTLAAINGIVSDAVDLTVGGEPATGVDGNDADGNHTIDFGFGKNCGSIGDYVWSDLNNNGTNDEPTTAGINGVTVELWDATTNTLVSSTTTANDGSSNPGYYSFTVCTSGDYKVKFPITNGGNNLTTQTATAATDNNSDANTSDGFSPTLTIAITGTGTDKDNLTIDAGYQPSCLKPDAGIDMTACAGTCTDITGTNPTTGTWSAMAGNPAGATLGTTLTGIANVCFDASSTGTYNFIYNIGSSCEDTMSIVVNPQSSNTTTATACDTYTWAVNSIAYTASGTYTVTSTNANGCVHTEILNLTINASTSNTTTISACNTYTWSVNSTAYTSSGTYTETSTNAAGCPHTETLNLTINTPSSSTTNVSSCPSALPYSWNGQSISTAGTYTHNATDVNGCDSVATLIFTISSTSTSTTNVTVCTAMLPYSWNTQSLTAAGTYTFQTIGVTGCDSIATLILTVADGTVGNYVWSDLNNNGTNDEPTTAGINGVTVELWDATTNTLVSSTTTANDGSSNPGYYSFTVCTSGDYKVKFPTTNSGNNLTTQTSTAATDNNSDANTSDGFSPTFTITTTGIGNDKDNITIDAGYSVPVLPAQLGNFVWNDANQNGVQDVSEFGVGGVTVNLINTVTNAIVAITTTNATGYYSFNPIPAGTYKLMFSLLPNYVFTGQNSPDDNLDSDPNMFTGVTDIYTIAAGDSNMTVDAGIYNPNGNTASVGDKVWFDTDGNGIQDPTEVGVGGITVSLYNCSNLGMPIATMVTDAQGKYKFEGVAPGSYSVGFAVPLGMVFTNQTGSVSDINNSDVNTLTERTACFTVVGGDAITYVDAGMKPKPIGAVSLGDKVWNDVNQDGIQDPLESGVAGVTVTLYASDGITVISTTSTNGLGEYSFNNQPAGCYVVGFSNLPIGYVISPSNVGSDSTLNSDADVVTGKTVQICLTAGQNNSAIDAGIFNATNTNSIGNKVWKDLDHNGIQNVGELGFEGMIVNLCDNGGNVIGTTVTDVNGDYIFNGLANGIYSVKFNFPVGYQFTGSNTDGLSIAGADNSDANPATGKTEPITLTGNTIITYVDAGVYPGSNRNGLSTLGDFVWEDVNSNGIQDVNEVGVPNVTITLYQADATTVVATTLTDGNGGYLFTGLTDGQYVVGISTLPLGYTITTQSGNIEDETNSDVDVASGKTSIILLGLGEDVTSVDAGLVPASNSASLGNFVWYDLNNDGLQDSNEPGVSGVTVQLLSSTNVELTTISTNLNGFYTFGNLAPGTYSVKFSNLPAGFTFTTQSGVVSDVLNSDANTTTGQTAQVTLVASENNITLDAGIVSLNAAVVGNYVWYDMNEDGIQGAGENPVSGVTVTLYDNTNTAIATTITDVNGKYLFTNVAPATYTIGFSNIPGGYSPTTKGTNAAADDDSNVDPLTGKTDAFTVTAGSSNLTLDAGLRPSTTGLGNYVWLDVIINGLQDATEPGISGVVVTLFASNGTTELGTTITDGNGAYSFPNLTAGDYVVGFSNIPLNLIVTTHVGILNDALNNDIITVDMKTAVITLNAGTFNPNIDAGFKYQFTVPVAMKDFTVLNEQCNVFVNWVTSSEKNTSHYNVMRTSTTTNTTKQVARITAKGTSQSETSYSYTDREVATGSYTYHLEIVDIDGQQSLSDKKSVQVNCKTNTDKLSVYPNPTTGQLNIRIVSEQNDEYTINVRDAVGRLVMQTSIEVDNTTKNTIMNLSGLAAGTYSVEVLGFYQTQTFIIQLSK